MTNKFRFVASRIIGLALLISLALSANSAHAFDRQKLKSDGEVYAVALHDSYIAASREPEIKRDVAHYFKARAKAIENGAETLPANPAAFPVNDQSMRARLEWAYEEAQDTVTSEAADEAPYTTAHVEIAYERWLITMHDDPGAADAEKLANDFEARLDNLTASPNVSALGAGDWREVAARF
jgi:hypothetical protein